MNNALCEVLNMCYRISNNSKADVFFEYAPHCGSYSVYWYPDGWKTGTSEKIIYIDLVTQISYRNLKKTIERLDAIEREAKWGV